MTKGYKTNEQGRCPKCNGLNLDYDPLSYGSDMMAYYHWKCADCGQEGEEWYSMEFQGHNVFTEDGESIEL